MKKILSLLSLAALTVGLLGSCSKINERIDSLEKRIDGIESNQIASIKSQVDAINTSIADLGTIRQNVQALMNTTPSKEDIEELRRADEALGRRIDELKSYTDGELTKYATTEWVKATFATLEQHQWTCDTIAKIDARIGALDAKLSQSISGLESSLKQWVNEQLDAYYTAAQMDAKLGVMQAEIDVLKNSKDSERIDSLATELTKTKVAVDSAKANIRSEYNAAVQSAIETSEGKLTQALKDSIAKVNDKITALDTRVTSLEIRMQAVEGKVDNLEAAIGAYTELQGTITEIIKKLLAEVGDKPQSEQDTTIWKCITALQAQCGTFSTDIQTLQGFVGNKDVAIQISEAIAELVTTQKLTGLADAVSKLKDIVDVNVNDVKSLTQQIADINTALSTTYVTKTQLGQDIAAAKAGLQKQIDSLCNVIGKDGTAETATGLYKEIAQLNAKIAALAAVNITINSNNYTKWSDAVQAVLNKVDALGIGNISGLQSALNDLEARLDKIEAMIQSVSITPAYSDGSVEAVKGILTLKCIVSPAEAISGMASLKDSLLIYADSVKVKTKGASAYMEIKVSEASVLDAAQGAITLKADISEYLPKGEDKALTVAVNIKNGISDFTTEFVPVTPIVEYVEIAAKYDGSTVSTLRWYRQNLAITGSGRKAWTDDSGSAVKVPGMDEDVVVGDYFQWGTFTGFYGNGADPDKGLLPYTSFTSTGCGDGSNDFTFKDGKQFNQTNAPYWSGSAYTKYNTTDNKKTLDVSDDAANIILGGTWRMPTSAEIIAMKAATYWKWDATDKGYYVYTPNPASDKGKVNDGTGTYNKADALLFFPTAGNGYENTYYDVESIADYWASSLNSTLEEKACHLFFNSSGSVNADSREGDRYRGYSVRPVQDPAAKYEAVTNVSLNVTAKKIEKGGNVQLIVTVAPATATQKGVYWTSDKPAVATVDPYGKVTGVAAGTATITATTVDGNQTATCTVEVPETKTMGDILKTTTGIPESQNLTPPENAWVNSTDPTCKAFVGIDAAEDTLFVIMKEGLSNPPGVCMNDEFEKIDDNTYKRTEKDFTFTVKMTGGKFTSLEFNTNIESIKFLNGTYAAPKPVEPEYVEIGGVKWATKNLGATTVAGSGETCYGDYYAWGVTAPYYEGTGGWPATPTWKSGKESGYAWESYCGSSSFSEWSTPPYDATTKILKPDFDAAAQILGDGWRMPTSAEFQALYDACLNGSYDKTTNPSGASAAVDKGVYWCTSYDGVAGCLFCDGANKLFFPAAGFCDGTSLSYEGSRAVYLSSSFNTDSTSNAYSLGFNSSLFYTLGNSPRYRGSSVRPVKDAAPVQ